MANYEILLVDEHDRISAAYLIAARNDIAALEAAIFHCNRYGVEIWRDLRCVATLEKGLSPLDAMWTGVG
ncbi:MAG: hypothetical protein J0I19_08275 [Alphaproteobacteria bacterium]|nr:hypothetical protein [Alphaproteobacteria bacterium]